MRSIRPQKVSSALIALPKSSGDCSLLVASKEQRGHFVFFLPHHGRCRDGYVCVRTCVRTSVHALSCEALAHIQYGKTSLLCALYSLHWIVVSLSTSTLPPRAQV